MTRVKDPRSVFNIRLGHEEVLVLLLLTIVVIAIIVQDAVDRPEHHCAKGLKPEAARSDISCCRLDCHAASSK
jgi:hypothetical protein